MAQKKKEAKTAAKTKEKKAAPAAASKIANKKGTTVAGLLARDAIEESLVSPTKRALLNKWSAGHNKEGHTVVATADMMKSATDLKCPSGIMSLDIDCGGGLPANRMSIISGPDNSGKTFLLMKYMAMHQRLYRENSSIGLALVEPFAYWRARQLGVMVAVPDNLIDEQNEIRRLDGRPPMSAEEVRYYKTQIGEFRLLRGDTGEETMNIVLDAVRSKLFGFIGIDSLNSMLPAADAEKDVGEAQKRAGNAGLMTDFMKKYQPLTNMLDENNFTTVVGLSQVRANAERQNAPAHMQKYLKEYSDSMAWALRHLRSIGMMIWKGGNDKDGNEVVGHTLHWNVVKGKDGTHDGIAGSTMYWHPPKLWVGTDDIGTVIIEGVRLGVFLVQQSGVVTVKHPTQGNVLDTIDNIPLLAKMLASDFDYELRMRRLVLLAAGKTCLYLPLQ